MAETYRPLTDEQVARIAKEYFDDRALRSAAMERPRLILVGAQPGAGKSAASALMRGELRSAGGFIHVDADKLREEIPLGTSRPSSAETQADAGRLVGAVREMAVASKRNIIEEGTFRNPQSVARYVDLAHQKGYQVELVAVSTARDESLLGIHQRHEHQHASGSTNPRFVTTAYHDEAMQGFDKTLSELASRFDRVRVIKRDGELLFDSISQPREQASKALADGRVVSADRATMIQLSWAAVARAAHARGAGPEHLAVVDALAQGPGQSRGSTYKAAFLQQAHERLEENAGALVRDPRYAQHSASEVGAVALYRGLMQAAAQDSGRQFDQGQFDARMGQRAAAAKLGEPPAAAKAAAQQARAAAPTKDAPARGPGMER